MKISPMIQGVAAINPNEGMSAGSDRMIRAKAIAAGEAPTVSEPETNPYPANPNEAHLNRIKVKTQNTPGKLPERTAENVPPSDNLAINEQAKPVSEATKPLSPIAVALAKQKRALQLKEQAVLAKEKALEGKLGSEKSLEDYRARLKANALNVLMEEGVTYDQLTEQVLAHNQQSHDLEKVKTELQAMKQALENQNKTLSERDQQAEDQVLRQIGLEANQMIAQGDEFELVKAAGYVPKVVELVKRTFKEKGEYLDTHEALSLMEQALMEDALKWAQIKKVQSRLTPTSNQQPQTVQQNRLPTKTMRTLTNKDGVSSISMSRRERAIAAMEGRLK